MPRGARHCLNNSSGDTQCSPPLELQSFVSQPALWGCTKTISLFFRGRALSKNNQKLFFDKPDEDIN
jgi:hypothetical protein